MSKKYLFRKNFKSNCQLKDQILSAHFAFKTQDICWLNTSSPVVVLASVHSEFHNENTGHLKMEAFLSIIKSCTTGNLAILIADTSHFHADSLLYNSSTKQKCLRRGEELLSRYFSLFAGLEILFWHALMEDKNYLQLRSIILKIFHTDLTFQKLLLEDAVMAYTKKRESEFADKDQFIKMTVLDLLDQCILMQILEQKKIKYIFYPGAPCKVIQYLNKLLSNKLKWINVFLTIEKKTSSCFSS